MFRKIDENVKEPKGLKPGAVKISTKRPITAVITDPSRPGWKEHRGPDAKPVKKTNEETMSESVRNIITATMEDNAIEVQSAIHTAIGEKIKDALEAKRVIVAQNLVGMGEGFEQKPKSIGKTYDGVNVLQPKTKSKNFTPTEVKKSIKDLKKKD